MPVSQGVQQMGIPPNSGQWHDGLFECINDLPICCYGCCCMYCLFGSNAQNLNNQIGCLGQTCLAFVVDLVAAIVTGVGCSCFVTMTGRTILRNKYGLPASPCGDCISHCCCQSCSLCQEAREIQHRNTEARRRRPRATSTPPRRAPRCRATAPPRPPRSPRAGSASRRNRRRAVCGGSVGGRYASWSSSDRLFS